MIDDLPEMIGLDGWREGVILIFWRCFVYVLDIMFVILDGFFGIDDGSIVVLKLGIDHEKLIYRFSGRDIRLTDVHGHVIEDILL